MSLLDTASLIVTPNGYKEGKLYSVIPSDGSGDMSVVRATTATRVNSAGLVELVPYNLLSYSEQFDNVAWTKTNATITSNATTAPDGTLSADKFESTAAAVCQLSQSINSPNTISIYAKAGNIDILNFWTGSTVTFNLTSGTVTAGTATIENAGNGWWRCIIPTTHLAVNPFIIASASGQFVYVWGAQANEGTIKPYQKTETRLNIPRLDYSNGTCPSLLVEPQRTNLAFPSQDITAWFPSNMTNTANQTISPDGTQNAGKSTIVANNNYHDVSTAPIVTTVSGTTYTTSFFAKKGTGIESIYFYQGNNNRIAKFNLNDGTYIGNAPSNGYNAFTSYSSENYGNGWYRFTATYTASTTIGQFVIGVSTNTNDTVTPFTGNGTDFVYVWGLQYELGSYSTSYIPTTSASVTRNADVISKTGISSLIGQTEGTIFFDGVVNGCQNAFANLINAEKNTNTSFDIGYIKANKNIVASVFASGVEKGKISNGIFEIGERVKIAYAYKSGDSALYVNGSLMGTSTDTFTFPSTLDDIFIGDAATYFFYQEAITNNASALWKTRLTNAELATLTTI